MGLRSKIVSAALALGLALGVSVPAHALEMGTRPADGTTTGQPFPAGTGGSANFRIPGIVTLDDGTIVAATDARWNTGVDAGGLDTIVSRSTDGGATWHYTFANYLGDNGNVFNNLSTCFIDPAIATDGETTYLVADLFPAGMAINSSRWRAQPGSEYDENGNMRLRDAALVPFDTNNGSYDQQAAAAAYDYYLDLETYEIRRAADDSLVEGYTVDAFFNIKSADGTVDTNLFCEDSPYMPFPTDFLYMTKSTDGGATWSEPTLIKAKNADEQVLLVGPGTGIVLEDGTIVFSVYEFTSGKSNSGQFAGIVWSYDGGKTWERSAETTTGNHWSSEATTVQIDDTTIRQFYRDGYTTLHYTDFTKQSDGTWVPGDPVDTGVTKTSNNQLAAVRLDQQIDGKDAVVVSTAASGGSGRNSGMLYVGLLNDDNTMEWKYAYRVNAAGAYYAYSSVAEMKDGSGDIVLLYENAGTSEKFVRIPMSDIAKIENESGTTVREVPLVRGDSASFTDATGDLTSADVSALDTDVATLSMKASEVETMFAQLGSNANYDGAKKLLADSLYTFTKNSDGTYTMSATDAGGNKVYLAPGVGSAGKPNNTTSETMTVSAGYVDDTVYLRGTTGSSGSYLYFDKTALKLDRVNTLNNNTTWMNNCSAYLYRPVAEGETASTEIPGYVRVTGDALTNPADGQYLIVFQGGNGAYYALYPSTSAASNFAQMSKVVSGTTTVTTLTFTAVGEGQTVVRVGNVYYRVTVAGYYEKSVSLDMDGTATVTDETGDWSAQVDDTAFDKGVATYEVSAKDNVTTITFRGVAPGKTTLVVGRTRYTVTVTGAVQQPEEQLRIGDTVSYLVAGDYTGADTSSVDIKVATVELAAATGALTNGSEASLISDNEYTFVSDGNGGFTASATTASGETVYLSPAGQKAGYPFSTTKTSFTVSEGYLENTFYLRDATHYLHNHDGRFDRVGTLNNGDDDYREGCSLVLFRPATSDEAMAVSDEAIPGYERVTDLSEVGEGSYLVAFEYNGSWHMLHPSTSTAGLPDQVATVSDGAATQVTFTAVGAGTTSLRVGDVRYVIEVAEPTVYTVTFDPNGGTLEGDATREVEEGKPVGELPTPTLDGHTFLGWFDGEGNEATADTVVTADMTLTAKWEKLPDPEPTVYTVTFDPNGGTLDGDATREVEEGKPVGELPVPEAPEGFTFRFWADEENNEVTADTVVTSDMTLKAIYEAVVEPPAPTVYTVTFDAGEGALEGDATRKVEEGKPIGELPVPSRDGHTFLGWFDGDVQVSADTLVTADMTLTAKWEKVPDPEPVIYTVTFDAGDGTLEGETTREVEEGKPVGELPTPTLDGHTFLGWFDGEGNEATADTVVTADMTLTAKWEKLPDPEPTVYTVTFDPNGGTLDGDATREVEDGKPVGMLPVPTREGFIFRGWYCGAIRIYAATPVFGDVTFVARWEQEPEPQPTVYTVTFDANEGTLEGDSTRKVEDGQAIGELPVPSRDGYTFLGWFDAEGNEATAETLVTADVTLTAKWEKVPEPEPQPVVHTVTFDAGDGTLDGEKTREVEDGKAIGELPTPTAPEGFTFEGWVDEEGNAFADDTLVTEDVTLSAVYKAVAEPEPEPEPEPQPTVFTVTFDPNGGTLDGDATRKVEDGKAIGDLPVPSREGYTFLGWFVDDAKASADTLVTADVTLTAKWEKKSTTTPGGNTGTGGTTGTGSTNKPGTKPSKPSKPTIPNAGDATNPALAVVALSAGALLVAGGAVLRRRSED